MTTTTQVGTDRVAMNLPWVESPFFGRELASRVGALGTEQARLAGELHEQGFVALRQAVPHELCDRVRGELAPLFDSDEVAVRERRVQDAWKRGAGSARELALLPSVLDLLRTFYERRPIAFQTLGFKWGTEQAGHSDSIHFSCLPARFMCGVWVALEDVGPDNGPLFYHPGSHRLPEVTAYDLGETVEDPRYDRYVAFQQELMLELGIEPVEFHARKGDALLWSSNIVHGGRPVTAAGSTRWSQVTHYYFEGCTYYTPIFSDLATGQLLLKDVVDLATMAPAPHTYNGRELTVERLANGRSRLSVEPGGDRTAREAQLAGEVAGLVHALRVAEEEIAALRASTSYRLGNAVVARAAELRRRLAVAGGRRRRGTDR